MNRSGSWLLGHPKWAGEREGDEWDDTERRSAKCRCVDLGSQAHVEDFLKLAFRLFKILSSDDNNDTALQEIQVMIRVKCQSASCRRAVDYSTLMISVSHLSFLKLLGLGLTKAHCKTTDKYIKSIFRSLYTTVEEGTRCFRFTFNLNLC